MSQTSLDTYGWGFYHVVEISTDNSASSSWSHICKSLMRGENHDSMRRILAYRYGQYQQVFNSRLFRLWNDFYLYAWQICLKKTPWISLCQSSLCQAACCCLLMVKTMLFGLKASLREDMWDTGSIMILKCLLHQAYLWGYQNTSYIIQEELAHQ